MTHYCKACNHTISQDEGTLIPPSPDGEAPAFCGFCGSDDLDRTYECIGCEQEFTIEGMSMEHPDLCLECEKSLNENIEQQAMMEELARIEELTAV